MYRYLFPAILAAAGAAFGQQPQLGQLDASPALFTVMAAVNAAGYDTLIDSPSNSALRKRVRRRCMMDVDHPFLSKYPGQHTCSSRILSSANAIHQCCVIPEDPPGCDQEACCRRTTPRRWLCDAANHRQLAGEPAAPAACGYKRFRCCRPRIEQEPRPTAPRGGLHARQL